MGELQNSGQHRSLRSQLSGGDNRSASIGNAQAAIKTPSACLLVSCEGSNLHSWRGNSQMHNSDSCLAAAQLNTYPQGPRRKVQSMTLEQKTESLRQMESWRVCWGEGRQSRLDQTKMECPCPGQGRTANLPQVRAVRAQSLSA